MHAGVRFDFTQLTYTVNENAGEALVVVTITSGIASRVIVITVRSTPGSAIGE